MAPVNPFTQINSTLPPLMPNPDEQPVLTKVFQGGTPAHVNPLAFPPSSPNVSSQPTPQKDAPASAPDNRLAWEKAISFAGDPKPKVVHPLSGQEQYEQRLDTRLASDVAKDNNPFGSANNHPGAWGKILHFASTVGNTAGNVLAPGAMARIPGTSLNRQVDENALDKQINTLKALQEENALKESQARNFNTDANLAPGKAQSEEALQAAQTENLQSETDMRNHPALEVHDSEEGPLLINRTTGTAQHVTVDGQPVGPKLTLKESQPIDGPDGKPHTYMLDDKGNKVVDLGVHYERPAVSVNAGEKNLWSVPQPDGSHKVVSLKAGDTIPEGAVSLSGQSSANAKEGANDKPTQDALTFANDYLQSGAFTGPSDEALQDQFFQMAKPSTGFRMNQAQINQLHEMASWMDSFRGKLYHATNGVWFAPEQRRQIVQTMNDLAKSKGIKAGAAEGGGSGGGGITVEVGEKSFSFPDQKSADAFKKAAGIK